MARGERTAIEISRAELSGIPLFTGPMPDGARHPATASIMFRVGRADEPLPRFGTTHLVEHLAMFGVGELDHPANAMVDDTRTAFYASGEPHEVASFLEKVVAALSALPLDRLELEKQVLEAESMTPPPVSVRMLTARYGARGYGVAQFRELGLRTATAETITSWARQRFTAGNAVIWAAGDL